MKLSVDVLNAAPSYINPVKDRELLLRGHRIPVIENLGVTKDQSDSIDFTDNEITHLSNIPRLNRLQRLLLAGNRISFISPSLHESVPNLTTLVLTSNLISKFSDLEGLKGLNRLTYLTFLNNPITKREHYREYIIWRIPSVRILDFEKIKNSERDSASKLFGTSDEPTSLAKKYIGD
ncbi:leucine-rich repeat-domain-containing protein [Lipomyces japonicus]|uniref:leucine-rich repeat-domain-containing protein n=1 Tax=Lipomyces japonicus TaxID=56871 RepID=UPI0034CE1DD4